ncbi:DUF89 domain-containing protein [Helicobacter sp. MIT 99-5507]|uniref:damage-control phosphatase ARMT1 family protein n=1 Tax=Helicobacter sp. MIT 99-5507 TaxID=152489 RepID=UPI000E1F92D2|nr:ARMT1-like domain-containing protein [Helicobacter sp. MIT 99-5507]RDU58666.1 hypothetical protein CQA42_02500 [Helicobacter sp. MIT 99-5507]
MNLKNECKICLYHQIKRFLNGKNEEILDVIKNKIEKLDTNLPPPQAAIKIYEILAKNLKCDDPYKQIKQDSINLAKIISKTLRANTLSQALKASVIGNAIDYGSQNSEDIQYALQKTMNEEFAINDIDKFKNALLRAKNILFIADNAGENYFDEILLRFIKQHYDITITYAVRGKPIINDLTLNDIKEHKSLFEICNVIDSGVPSPGFIYDFANDEAKKYFDNASIIFAKGMGNFECLESIKDKRLFLLFKIKCSVVSEFTGQIQNKLIFLNNY